MDTSANKLFNVFIENYISFEYLHSTTKYSNYPPWSQPAPPQNWRAAGWCPSASTPDVTSWVPNSATMSDRPETESRCYCSSFHFSFDLNFVLIAKRKYRNLSFWQSTDHCSNDAASSQTHTVLWNIWWFESNAPSVLNLNLKKVIKSA